MYINNFRRSIVLIGLTLTPLLGIFAEPVFALPSSETERSQHSTQPGSKETRSVYLACGAINTGLGATPNDEALSAAACFSHAYAVCRPATLKATFSGIDAGVRRTFFTVKEPSRCLVVDVAENYVIPALLNDRTDLCSSVELTNDGLLLKDCGRDGDILLPANAQ